MRRVLVVYAPAGFGHMKAAIAVKEALQELKPKNTEIRIVDSLDYTNEFYKRSYQSAYSFLVTHLPAVWGFFYYILDNKFARFVVSPFIALEDWLNAKKLREFIGKFKPDAVISTHFLASRIIAKMKSKLPDTKLITVITDYMPHSFWVSKSDFFVVASEDAKRYLESWGIDRNKIKLLGIPIRPEFLKKTSKEGLRERLGFERTTFTIFLSGGGFGMGPIINMLNILNNAKSKIQVIALCGNNKSLYERVRAMQSDLKFPVHILKFVSNVYDYMAISDIFITKAGGIITTEALAKELPMLLTASIPGQETRNSSYLERNGAAIRIENLGELGKIIEDFANNPRKLARLKKNIKRIRKPNACYDIARLAL